MNYIFYLPNYVPYSNGIKSLWYSAYLFSKKRHVIIVPYHGGELGSYDPPCIYKELIKSNFFVDDYDVVIYPDVVEGNPLKIKKVVRYLMAKPFILNGSRIYMSDSDFLISFSRAVDCELPQLTVLLPELVNLRKYKKDKKENTVIIYYGKCRLCLGDTKIKEVIKDFDNVKIITRTIPRDKDALYHEIASASLFVSFDPLSSLSYEANLVGTPSLLLDSVFREEYDNFNHKLFGFFYDYPTLKKENLVSLGENIFKKSHADLHKILYENEENVSQIIYKIEDWFNGFEIRKDLTEARAINFFNQNWQASPIINCTTFSSVIAYSLMRKNFFLYIIARLIIGFRRGILNFIRVAKRRLAQALFTSLEVELIQYKLNPGRRKIQFENNTAPGYHQGASESVIRLDNSFKSFVWRLLCM